MHSRSLFEMWTVALAIYYVFLLCFTAVIDLLRVHNYKCSIITVSLHSMRIGVFLSSVNSWLYYDCIIMMLACSCVCVRNL